MILEPLFSFLLVGQVFSLSSHKLSYSGRQSQYNDLIVESNIDKKVNVTAFVMSRCPDAVFCERSLKPVLEQVGNLVDFKTEVRTFH